MPRAGHNGSDRKNSGNNRDRIQEIWGERTPFEGQWPARADERVELQPDSWVQSCCLLCSNG